MVEKENLKKVIEDLKKAKQRKFSQSYDLIVNLKDIDLKKTENQIDLFITLRYSKGKENTVCALIGPESKPEADANCDFVIEEKEFEKYQKDPKATKRLADKYDFFIAQANIMPKIAGAFGKIFGPRKKMPNPKAGCVFPPKAALKPLVAKLKNMVRVTAKESGIIQVTAGNEKMADEEVIDNIKTIYEQIIHKLPGEKNNIRNIYLKLTMAKPIKIM